jgi:hypothetical protein
MAHETPHESGLGLAASTHPRRESTSDGEKWMFRLNFIFALCVAETFLYVLYLVVGLVQGFME